MNFDPEAYTVSVRKENHDGDIYYVGRAEEFPNINSFEDTPEDARIKVIEAIETLKKMADETRSDFPAPLPTPSDEFSGRITLRLPKSLHAKVSRFASADKTSVNQLIVTAVASYVGEIACMSKFVSFASEKILHGATFATEAITPVDYWERERASFIKTDTSIDKFIIFDPKEHQPYQLFLEGT